MAIWKLVLSGLFPTFLICNYLAASQTTDDDENEGCSCPIPGTKLYADVYYEIRLVHPTYAGWPLTYSVQIDKMYGIAAVDPSKNENFMRDGQIPDALQWRFVETEKPGWYLLQNKNHPDKYVTWGEKVGEKLFGNFKWRLMLDPNFEEEHYDRMDFFVRPYRPRGVDIYIHQLKFKNRPIAVVSWSFWRDPRSTDVPIQLDMSDQQHLRNYEPGNKWFQDTLFEIREVKKNKSVASSTGWIDTFSWPIVLFLFSAAGSLGRILTIF